jgi:hypothetical protein
MCPVISSTPWMDVIVNIAGISFSMFRVNGWNWTMRRTRSARRHVIATNRITPTGYDEASAFSGPEFIEVNKLTTIISLLELIFKKF